MAERDDLAVYAAWVPMLRAEESDVQNGTRLVHGPNLRHFWDGHSALVNGYKETLGLGVDAWDIYLVYGPEATWETSPPKPRFWMHQLFGLKEGLWLEADRFGAEVRKALAGP